jgi:hypothetical protein
MNRIGRDEETHRGILPRTVLHLLQLKETRRISIQMSIVEVYNEEARDLLSNGVVAKHKPQGRPNMTSLPK